MSKSVSIRIEDDVLQKLHDRTENMSEYIRDLLERDLEGPKDKSTILSIPITQPLTLAANYRHKCRDIQSGDIGIYIDFLVKEDVEQIQAEIRHRREV